jgi:hypothetical protein
MKEWRRKNALNKQYCCLLVAIHLQILLMTLPAQNNYCHQRQCPLSPLIQLSLVRRKVQRTIILQTYWRGDRWLMARVIITVNAYQQDHQNKGRKTNTLRARHDLNIYGSRCSLPFLIVTNKKTWARVVAKEENSQIG